MSGRDFVTYVVNLTMVGFSVRQGTRHVPIPKNSAGNYEDKLSVALKVIEGEGVEIKWVVPKYTPGQLDETFRVVTVAKATPQP